MRRDDELSFGEWLEDQLAFKHLDQVAFASMIGVAQSTVSSWVNNVSKPRRRVIPVIAAALKVDAELVADRAGFGRSRVNEPQTPTPGEIDFDDPFLMFWASYSGDIDPHDKEILKELAKSLLQKKGIDIGTGR